MEDQEKSKRQKAQIDKHKKAIADIVSRCRKDLASNAPVPVADHCAGLCVGDVVPAQKPEPEKHLEKEKYISYAVPQSILTEMISLQPPPSVFPVISWLYRNSLYRPSWKMRSSEFSCGLVAKKTKLCIRTVKYALSWLRSKWFIRLIWRGYPDPEGGRYRHSCYELPYNMKHVQSWRIHKGRPRKRSQF